LTDRDERARMEAIQAGDEEAFEAFVRDRERRFFRIALGYLGDVDEARDAAQETFVRIWRKRHTWRPEAGPGVWAQRILANHCLDRIRRRKVRSGPSLEEWEEARGVPPADASAPDPLAEVQRSEDRRRVMSAVRRLPDRMRLTVLMRFAQELPLQTIADLQDRSLGTVKATLHRALRRLHAMLAAEDGRERAEG
jgi:RNA polymerase sigma-70 factor (ECF subfamily)